MITIWTNGIFSNQVSFIYSSWFFVEDYTWIISHEQTLPLVLTFTSEMQQALLRVQLFFLSVFNSDLLLKLKQIEVCLPQGCCLAHSHISLSCSDRMKPLFLAPCFLRSSVFHSFLILIIRTFMNC